MLLISMFCFCFLYELTTINLVFGKKEKRKNIILQGALSQVVCQDHFQWVYFQIVNSALHQISYVCIALIGPLNHTFLYAAACHYTL